MGIGDIFEGGGRSETRENSGAGEGSEIARKILGRMNPEQAVVVRHFKGPILAAAVAGAGKTAALVNRIGYLVKVHGVDPSRILAVTFSKKGAEEMNERLEKLIGESEARVGTFHSLALEIVKKECHNLDKYEVDSTDKYRFCIKDAAGYREMDWKDADASYLSGLIGKFKASVARPWSDAALAIAEHEREVNRSGPRPYTNPDKCMQVYEIAERLRNERQQLGFDDMLVEAVELFQRDEDVRRRWASRFEFVLQDEAQDQNLAQLLLGELLAKDHKNYMLVGDPAQTIFTWRGAQPSKLLGFEQTWGAKVVKMGRNYRCGQVIIDVANKALANMDPAQKLDMEMICERKVPGTLTATLYEDLEEEGRSVADRVLGLREDGMKYGDIAVLYRTNALSRAVEEALLGARIPYRVIGGANFYERREVRSLLSYLRLVEGRGEIEDVEKCINAPFRYLGKAVVERVQQAGKVEFQKAKAEGASRPVLDWVEIVRRVGSQAGLQGRQRQSIGEWADLLRLARKRIVHGTPIDAIKVDGVITVAGYAPSADDLNRSKPAAILEDIVLATHYQTWLEKEEGEESTENSRVSNVRELIRAAGRFSTVKELLDYIDITTSKSKKERKDTKEDKVTLMTLHRSKGLEWPVVNLIGVTEQILPHARAEDLEEERRLFYVGVTRARDTLAISCVANIATGRRVIPVGPSSFLHETGVEVRDSRYSEVDPSSPQDEFSGLA